MERDYVARFERLDSGELLTICADQGRVLLGRANDVTVRLVHPNVSRRQAMLLVRDDGVLIERLDGSAEMRLNSDVLTDPAVAKQGDVLSIGNCQIRLADHRLEKGSGSNGPAVHDAEDLTMLGTAGAATEALPWSTIPLTHDVRIGRDAMAVEVMLPHPLVSRVHAKLQRSSEGHYIEDLGSANGTFVNGVRIAGPHLLLAGDEIACGPFSIVYTGTEVRASSRRRQGSIEASGVWKGVPHQGTTRWLLKNASLSINAGEFVAIIGPSGCGKSTLLRVLAGRSSFNDGSIHLCGYSVASELDAVRRSVAVVPQRETLFDALTVREMLDFTGDLRLPADTSRLERKRLVDTVLAEVGLVSLAEQRIETLSGGQRRRTVLANEILSGPSLVFLDEVTSGLDEGSDLEIMRLLRQLADTGRAVVCVTHSVANLVDLCDRVVVMARGGVVVCDESPERILERFGVARFAELYPRLAEGAESGSSPPAAAKTIAPAGAEVHGDTWRQFGVLALRELRLLLAKPRLLALSAGQSVIIAAALRLAFGGPPFRQDQALSLDFFLGMCCFWFGCNNSSKEIVKQRDILVAEYAVNLQLRAFVFAKVWLQCVVAILQVFVLLTTLKLFGVDWPTGHTLLGFLASAAAGVCLGLVISGWSESLDQAATLVPISLIPQLLLSGIVTTYPTALVERFAQVFVSGHWMGRVAVAAATQQTGRAIGDALVLTMHAGVLVVALVVILRRRLANTLRR
ncbi:MAG: ATP-binding cassette domain-containing protein [Gemmatimonadaceae bacterium]|nr:ATP-binding cassette domain-containing protein [Gemmatimonadaceae bacterium]